MKCLPKIKPFKIGAFLKFTHL